MNNMILQKPLSLSTHNKSNGYKCFWKRERLVGVMQRDWITVCSEAHEFQLAYTENQILKLYTPFNNSLELDKNIKGVDQISHVISQKTLFCFRQGTNLWN